MFLILLFILFFMIVALILFIVFLYKKSFAKEQELKKKLLQEYEDDDIIINENKNNQIEFVNSNGQLKKINSAVVINCSLDLFQEKRKNQRIVFTLSTIPSRLYRLHDLISNLLEQSINADLIYVNLPKFSVRENCEYELPKNLNEFKDNPRVLINIVEEDEGPSTKIFPTLRAETNPETMILPVDDDTWFPINYFEDLVVNSAIFPNTVFGYHGISYSHSRNIHYVNENICPVDIVETVCGSIYRRKFFDDRIFNLSRDSPCFFTDDIWINAHVAKNKISRFLLLSGKDSIQARGRANYRMRHVDCENPLWKLNCGEGGNNDKCSNSLIHIFESNRFLKPF